MTAYLSYVERRCIPSSVSDNSDKMIKLLREIIILVDVKFSKLIRNLLYSKFDK